MHRQLSLPVWRLSLILTLSLLVGVSAVGLAADLFTPAVPTDTTTRSAQALEVLCKNLTTSEECDRSVSLKLGDSDLFFYPSLRRADYLRKQRELEQGAAKVTFETPFLTNVLGDSTYIYAVSRQSLAYLHDKDLALAASEMELRHHQLLDQVRDGSTVMTAIFATDSLQREIHSAVGDQAALAAIRAKYQRAVDLARTNPNSFHLVMVPETSESFALIEDARGRRWVTAAPQAQRTQDIWWSQRIFSDLRETGRVERHIDEVRRSTSTLSDDQVIALLERQLGR